MRNLLIAIFVLLVASAVPAFAQYDSQPAGGKDAGAGDMQQQSQQKSGASDMVSGTVVDVDPQSNSITIADYVTGSDRTFMANKDALKDLKTGDKVNITPDKDNASAAKKIEKNRL